MGFLARVITLAAVGSVCGGCLNRGMHDPSALMSIGDEVAAERAMIPNAAMAESLFKEDQAVLSNEDLQKIIDKNWDLFKDRFDSREDLKSHFLALKNYRNPLGHARDMDIVEQKQGEAAVVWFRRTLSGPVDTSQSTPVTAEAGVA